MPTQPVPFLLLLQRSFVCSKDPGPDSWHLELDFGKENFTICIIYIYRIIYVCYKYIICLCKIYVYVYMYVQINIYIYMFTNRKGQLNEQLTVMYHATPCAAPFSPVANEVLSQHPNGTSQTPTSPRAFEPRSPAAVREHDDHISNGQSIDIPKIIKIHLRCVATQK